MSNNAFQTYPILLLLLAGCLPGSALPPSEIIPTVALTSTPVITSTQRVKAVTPDSVASPEPRTLIICLGSQPETLYTYGGQMLAIQSVLEAVYDGPIDRNSFGYQPVILAKLPSLADGDAEIQAVTVQEGDLFIDNEGGLNHLFAGEIIRPAGCQSSDCAVTHTGGAIEMDRMVVTFVLLENLKWSDGTPLTALDSVYSYKIYAAPETPTNKFLVERTASYEALDKHTARWTGLPGFLDQTYFLNFWAPLPEHAWGHYTASELLEAEDAAIKPIGWGPYIIEEWQIDNQIVLTRNPHYFRADQGLPKFDRLIFRIVGNDLDATLSRLLSGECDVLDQDASRHLREDAAILDLRAEGAIEIYFAQGTVLEYLVFALQSAEMWEGFSATGAFQDVQLRQAIALCSNRPEAVEEASFGQSTGLDSYLPSVHPLFNPKIRSYNFDVNSGNALLEEIGWVDHDGDPATPRIYQGDNEQIPLNTQLEFHYWTTAVGERPLVTQILSESMAGCGIKADVQLWDPEDFYRKDPPGPFYGRQFDVVEYSSRVNELPPCDLWLAENIPGDPSLVDVDGNHLYPKGWDGVNISGYDSTEYAQACKTALSLLSGQPGFIEAYMKTQEILARDLPIIPLYQRLKLVVTRPDFCGLIMDPTALSEMWNIEEFDYGVGCE